MKEARGGKEGRKGELESRRRGGQEEVPDSSQDPRVGVSLNPLQIRED